MDSVEVAARVVQQFAFDPSHLPSGHALFLQACSCIRKALRSERQRDQLQPLLCDLIPALFPLTHLPDAHQLLVDLVSVYVCKQEIRVIPLLLSCVSGAGAERSVHALLYLGVAFDALQGTARSKAAEKIRPTLVTLSKSDSGKLREKAEELMTIIQPYITKAQEKTTKAVLPIEEELIQWLNSAHPQLSQSLVLSLGEIRHFQVLLSYTFDATASNTAKAADIPDKATSALTDVSNTSKLLKIPSFSASEQLCNSQADLHLEQLVPQRPSLEDIDRACRLLSCWVAKDSKRLISHFATGTLLQTLITQFIFHTSVQNLCLFVFLFNPLLTHESAGLIVRELGHIVIGSLATVLVTTPLSRLELAQVSGALSVLSHIVQTISSSAQMVAIDEVKLDTEKGSSQSSGPLQREVFVTSGKEVLGGVVGVYTRDYWTVECELGGGALRNEAGTLLNFILAKLNSELQTYQDPVLAYLAENAPKIERVLQVIMRSPAPTQAFSLPSHTVDRPMSVNLLEVIITLTRMLTSAQAQAFSPECWATILQLVFIHSYWNSDSLVLPYDANSLLRLSTPTKLVYTSSLWSWVGTIAAVSTAVAFPAETALKWHFVGMAKCMSGQNLLLCRDGICSNARYKTKDPLTSNMGIFIGNVGSEGYFQGRVGDLALITNQCLALSDFNYRASTAHKPVLSGCVPVAYDGQFYDACSANSALLVPAALSGSPDLAVSASLSTYPGDEKYFYGRTVGTNQLILACYAAQAPSFSLVFVPAIQFRLDFLVTAGKITLTEYVLPIGTLPIITDFPIATTCPAYSLMIWRLKINTSSTLDVEFYCDSPVATTIVAAIPLPSLAFTTLQINGTKMYNLLLFWDSADTIASVKTKMSTYAPPWLPTLCIPPASPTSPPACSSCPSTYFLMNQRCVKCHWACQGCSGPTNAACYLCNAGFFSQPGKASLCLSTCPTGYLASGQNCVLGPNPQIDISFDNNLAGDLNSPNLHVQLGWDPSRFYPDFDFLDPLPVRHRGLFFNISESISLPSFDYSANKLVLNSDFAVDMWVLPYSYGSLFRVNTNNGYEDEDLLVFGLSQTYINWPYPETHNLLSIGLKTYNNAFQFLYTDLEILTVKTAWYHVGFSVHYNSFNDTTIVTLFVNQNWQIVTFPSFFVDYPEARHNIGFLNRYIAGYLGYIYQISIANIAKTMSEMTLKRGHCTGCAVCPISTKSCLSTCKYTEFVDSHGLCQACKSTCKYGCTRADSCNLCDDSLCYRCTTFDPNTCLQCYPGASFVDGKCKCDPGKFLNGQKCSETCDSGFYLDTTAGQCAPCEAGCFQCTSSSCSQCSPELYLENGHCSCGEGWMVASSGDCVRCDAVCKQCFSQESICTDCYTEYGYYLQGTTCMDCRSTPGYTGGLGKAHVVTSGLTSEQAINAVCKETCGDARVLGQLQCDDGNTSDGDGCSSTCEVEHGWECSSPPGLPSACVDQKQPEALLRYLKVTKSGYELTYSFSETVYLTEDINSLASVDIPGYTLFAYSFSPATAANSLYSPFTLTITPTQTIKKNSRISVHISDTRKVSDKAGNRLVTEKVSAELLDGFLTSTSQSVATGVAGLGGAIGGLIGLGVMTTLFGGGGLGPLWMLIEHCQVLNFIVYMSLSFPDNLKAFLHALNFANFAFIPNFYARYSPDVFPAPPQSFESEGLSSDFYMNCGAVFSMAAALLVLFGLVEVAGRLRGDIKAMERWRRLFRFSVPLRFGIETYLLLSLGVFLQVREPVPGEASGYISVISAFLVLGYLAFAYVLILWKVTFQSLTKLKEKRHKQRFGSLYEEFRAETKRARAFLLVQNVRRLAYVLDLVFLTHSGLAQAVLFALLTLGFAGYLLFLQPYKNLWLGNRVECACELTLALAMIMVASLTVDMTKDSREALGWTIIAFLCLAIGIHLIATVVMQYREIVKLVRRCMRRMVKRAAERQRRKILSGKEPAQAWPFVNQSISSNMESGNVKSLQGGPADPPEIKIYPVEELEEEALGEIRPVRE